MIPDQTSAPFHAALANQIPGREFETVRVYPLADPRSPTYAQNLIERRLFHEVHTSERRSFRGCRRRWDWIFRDNYYPLTTPKPLEFGVAFHVAMETMFCPTTWRFNHTVLGALAEKAFVETCWEQRRIYLQNREEYALEGEEADDYEERVALGRGMIKYFVERQLPAFQATYVPTHVEVSFDVPLYYPDGSNIYCKCKLCRRAFSQAGGGKWRGNPVVFSGRVDLIVHDMEGGFWVLDWKYFNVTHKVLTPTGWVRMGDLQDGDLVIGKNGQPTKVLGASPIQSKTVWEVELEDGSIAECSDDHKWTVFDRDNKLKVMTTKELAEAPSYQTYGLPVMNQVEFDLKPELIMDPYVLGSLIGDGYFGSGNLTYSSKSGETVQLLLKATPEQVQIKRSNEEQNTWWIVGPWRDQLRQLGLWGKLSGGKFIPQEYLFASVEDRVALLQGLYDTDGLASQLRICTTSEQLAKDICHLVRSLGGKASMPHSTERIHSNGKTINVPEYFVNFWLPESIQHCRLERKKGAKRAKRGTHRRAIVAVRKTGRVADMRCIAVDAPDCLYVAEDFVVTHNTAAQLSSTEMYLELDDQVASYIFALRRAMGLNIRGFIYHEQRKAFPEPPKENKVRRLGRLFSVNVNASTDYDTYLQTVLAHDKDAYEAGLYDDHLAWLQTSGIDYYRKFVIYKSDYELEQVEKNLVSEALDMVDPNVRIYPMPGRFSCNGCAFQGPCLSKNAGQDYLYALKTMYVKRLPYYKVRSSTDRGST